MPQNITNIKNVSALVIGINYVGSQYELYGCINDANSMNTLLLENGFKNIKILTDNTIDKPNKQTILSEFTKLLVQANKGDILFFSYSGHGSYIKDNNGNEITGYDQMICPLDFNMVLDDELKNIINKNLKSGVTLIALFDSCFSGSVLDLKYQYMDILQSNNLTENTKENETNGNVIMISGASDIQTSADTFENNMNQGAMTWAFLQCVKSKNNNKSMTWRELVTNMRQILSSSKYTQTPQLSSGAFFDIDSSFFI